MGKTQTRLKQIWGYICKHWFVFFAVAVYGFFTLYYMGPSVTSCSDTVYGFGDNTAGPIWRGMLANDQGLLGGSTSYTNYPYGDDTTSPVGATLIIQTILIRGLQWVAGPVCGYNLMNILGFMASALVMFGFIYWITKNRWVSLFAGYAVAFTPYYQMKVGGHPGYGFQALFIGIIWAFFRLLKYRRTRDAVVLGLLFGASVYFDPYFSLFSALVLLGLAIAWLIMSRQLFTRNFWATKRAAFTNTKQQFKKLLLAAGVALLAVLPLVAIYASQSHYINESVAASRGNVLMEAKACSNWPHEYLVPFVLHPLYRKIFGDQAYTSTVDWLRGGFSCGIGEDSVGLSVLLVTLVGLGAIVIMWDKLRGRKIGLSKMLNVDARLLVLSVTIIGVIGLLFALPPGRLQGILPTPSYELLQITQTWRTLARFYMLVNIALVMLAAILMVYIYGIFRSKKQRIVLALLFATLSLGLVVEYQAFQPFSGNALSTFSYSKDIPSVYTWLKDQDTIKVVAEYPLEQYGKESDAMSYYLTMQAAHKKKLFNSALSYGEQEKYKDGLKNLADPQTLAALKALGVDAVVVHGVSQELLGQLKDADVVFSAPQARFNINSHSPVVKTDNTVVLSLARTTPASYYIDLGEGFVRNTTIIKSVVDWEYEAVNGSKATIMGFSSDHRLQKKDDKVKVCFSAQMSVPEETSVLSISSNGETQQLGVINGSLSRYVANVKGEFQLNVENQHNMRVTKLGCENGE